MEMLGLFRSSQLPTMLRSVSLKVLRRYLPVKRQMRPTASELQDPVVTEFTPLNQVQHGSDIDDLSIDQMCLRISKELEKTLSDSAMFLIRTDWLEKWQSDDDMIYTDLWFAGYIKTFETDNYSCFEKISDTSERDCCSNCSRLTDEYPNSGVESSRHKTGSTPDNQSSENLLGESQNKIAPGGSTGKVGNTGEHVSASKGEKDTNLSGTLSCSETCPYIPLIVTKEQTSSSVSAGIGRLEASTVLQYELGSRKIKIVLTITCCVRGNELCIKFRCLKGEIFHFDQGTVLKETRLSVSAAVDTQDIILTSKDPSNDQSRVCSTGEAAWSYFRGTEGNHWYAEIEPTVQVPLLGGAGMGKIGIAKNERAPVQICQRGDTLALVKLKVGHKGCSRLDLQKVLVLARNVAYTLLARECNDVTCVDSQADSRPVILTGSFDPKSSSSGRRSIEITCCAEVEIDYIPEDTVDKQIKKEIIRTCSRKKKTISLCSVPGHVTFKGVVDLNIMS